MMTARNFQLPPCLPLLQDEFQRAQGILPGLPLIRAAGRRIVRSLALSASESLHLVSRISLPQIEGVCYATPDRLRTNLQVSVTHADHSGRQIHDSLPLTWSSTITSPPSHPFRSSVTMTPSETGATASLRLPAVSARKDNVTSQCVTRTMAGCRGWNISGICDFFTRF